MIRRPPRLAVVIHLTVTLTIGAMPDHLLWPKAHREGKKNYTTEWNKACDVTHRVKQFSFVPCEGDPGSVTLQKCLRISLGI